MVRDIQNAVLLKPRLIHFPLHSITLVLIYQTFSLPLFWLHLTSKPYTKVLDPQQSSVHMTGAGRLRVD